MPKRSARILSLTPQEGRLALSGGGQVASLLPGDGWLAMGRIGFSDLSGESTGVATLRTGLGPRNRFDGNWNIRIVDGMLLLIQWNNFRIARFGWTTGFSGASPGGAAAIESHWARN